MPSRKAGADSADSKIAKGGASARRSKPGLKNTIALIYDFDGTLSPRPMQEYTFLPQIGEDPAAFWAEVNAFAKKHQADNLITYMHLMYQMAKAKGVRIDRADLVAQGRSVELFAGVPEWFAAIGDYVRLRAETPVVIKHYLGACRRSSKGSASMANSLPCSHRNTFSRPTIFRTRSVSSPIPARRSVPHQQGRRGSRPVYQ